jgi:hypothetical protein
MIGLYRLNVMIAKQSSRYKSNVHRNTQLDTVFVSRHHQVTRNWMFATEKQKWNIIILEADKRRTYKSLENYTWHTDTYIHRLFCILVSLIFQWVYKLYSTWIRSSNCIIDPPFCSLCGVEGLMMMTTLPVVMIVSHDMRFAKPCIIALFFF